MFTQLNKIIPLQQCCRYWICSILLLLNSLLLQAQLYPVQVNTIIIPPYSPYTSDYVSSANDKMIVNLLLRDIHASNVQVRLRVNIEGQGVKLVTNPQANVPIITLDGGVPERLTGTDLEPYFRAEHLVFAGLNAGDYRQHGGKLPEGLYRICFDVYELKTGAKLSVASGCANAWIVLNDPPVINFPQNNARIAVREPQYITFQWTPRHKGSPNSAFSTEYELELVELMPGFNYNPQAGFMAGKPLYTITTMNTMLVYGPAEPQLESGRTYAFRVRAKSMVAAQELDLFKNNGYSEIFSFTYQGTCAMPQNTDAQPKGSSRAIISWNAGTPEQREFVISYRKANTPDAAWFEEKGNTNDITLVDLSPSTTYEYKVRCNCTDGGQSNFTEVKTVTTPADELANVAYNCGVIPATVSISNQQPLPILVPRDMFTAGDFAVKLTEVKGSNGTFSGKGYITIPYLNDARIAVVFNNAFINTDYRMTRGQVVTEYDPTWKNINDLDDYFEGGANNGTVITGTDTADVVLDIVVNKPEDIKVTPAAGTNADGTPAPGATLTVTGSKGETVTKQVNKLPATVKDAAGNIYKVDENGQVTQIAKGGSSAGALPPAAQLNQLHPDKAVVRFAAHANTKYAFDSWDPAYAKSQLFGAEYEKLSDNYYVAAKAVAAGQTDIVKAIVEIKDNTVKPDSIRFITAAGTQFMNSAMGNNTYAVNIVSGPGNDAQELYAIYTPADGKPITLGKLLIASYGQKQRKLVLVPVNGDPLSAQDIATTLNRVYDSIGVHWEVSIDQTFTDMSWDADGDQLLNVEGSGLFSTLTDEMKALNNAYIHDRKPEDKAVYLFLLRNGKGKDKLLAGDMPRNRQFGYLFTDGSGDMGLTAAHELGHGVFHLKHTFDGYGLGNNDLADNLMNYANGKRLTKFQWDAVHDPGVVWGVFEKDADAEQAIVSNIEQLEPFKNTDGSYTFLSLAGKPITLKGKLTQVSFVTAEDQWAISNTFLPLGVLIGFELNGKNYKARKVANTDDFLGYQDAVSDMLYTDSLSIKGNYKQPIIGMPCINSYKLVFKVFPTDYLDKHPDEKKVEKENKGAGTQKDLFFLSENLQQEGAAQVIYAKMDPLTVPQVFFLGNYAQTGNLCGMDALYAFRAAYLVKENPGLLNCLQDAEGDARAKIHRDYLAAMNTSGNGTMAQDNTTVVNPNMEEAAFMSAYDEKKPHDKNFLKYMYNLLEVYQQGINEKSPSYDNLSNEKMGHIIDLLDIRHVSGRTCLLRNLPLQLRISLLKKHTSWTLTTSKESLMADLVETTPDDDIMKLLEELAANNYALLWSLYKDINGGNSDRFMSVLSLFILRKLSGTEDLKGAWPNEGIPKVKTLTTRYLYVAQENTVNDEDGGTRKYKTISTGSESSIVITYLNFLSKKDIWGNMYYERSYNSAPFGFVRVRFLNNFRFPLLGENRRIQEGDDIVVPAIWVYWLLDRQGTVENWAALRLVLDAAGLIISAATMEPGPLLAVEAVMGTTDIAFTLADERIQASGTKAQQDLAEMWNYVYGSYAAGLITKAAVTAGAKFSISNTVASIGGKINQLKATPEKLLRFADDMGLLLQRIKTVGAASFDPRNLFYSFVLHVYMEAKIATYARNISEVSLMVAQGNQLVVKGLAKEISIANIIEREAQQSLLLTNLRWRQQGLAVERVIGKLEKINYVDDAGKEAAGDLEIVLAEGGQPFVRLVSVTPAAGTAEYTLAAFIRTFDNAGVVPKNITEEAYRLFNEAKLNKAKWPELEQLFKDNGLNKHAGTVWPPANGGYNVREVDLLPGMVFDRYQKVVNTIDNGMPELTGTFTSPVYNGRAFNYEARALEGVENSYDLYFEIVVKKALPFKGEEATIIPWHGHAGEGLQTRFVFPADRSYDWARLIKEGYIEVRFKGSPSGKLEVLPGNTVKVKF